MRRKIISLSRKMGYETFDKGKHTADMRAIYTWVKKYGKFNKSLNQHSYEELTELTSQVVLMYENHLKEVHK